jgi:hypothetical protein
MGYICYQTYRSALPTVSRSSTCPCSARSLCVPSTLKFQCCVATAPDRRRWTQRLGPQPAASQMNTYSYCPPLPLPLLCEFAITSQSFPLSTLALLAICVDVVQQQISSFHHTLGLRVHRVINGNRYDQTEAFNVQSVRHRRRGLYCCCGIWQSRLISPVSCSSEVTPSATRMCVKPISCTTQPNVCKGEKRRSTEQRR